MFRDRNRGEWLAPWGVANLHRLGLLDVVWTAGARFQPKQINRSGKARIIATPNGDTALTFYHPTVQEALLGAAARSGAEVIRGARVRDVVPGNPSRLPDLSWLGPALDASEAARRRFFGEDEPVKVRVQAA